MGERAWGAPVAAVAAVGLLALSGCWPQEAFGPEHQRWNPFEEALTVANAATLEESWSVEVDSLTGSPIVDGGRVVLGSSGSGAVVTAFDTATGTEVWEQRIDPPLNAFGAASAAVVVGDGLMATWKGPDCTAGEVRLDPATGAITEAATTTPASRSTPVPFGDRFAQYEVVVPEGTCDDPSVPGPPRPADILVRDTDTGEILWRAGETHQDQLPAVGGGHLFAGTHQMVGYDIDGCGQEVCPPLWEALDGNAGSMPLVVGNHVFASRGGALVALDAATGAVAWRGTTGTFPGAVVYADGVLYNTANNVLFAFDAGGCGATTCAPLWSAPLPPSSGWWSIDAAAGGVLYVLGGDPWQGADGTGKVIAIDPAACEAGDCGPIWESDLFTGLPRTISVAGGRAFVAVHRLTATAPDLVIAYAPAAARP